MRKLNSFFSQKPSHHFDKLCMLAFWYMEMKIRLNDASHMTKMAAMPI